MLKAEGWRVNHKRVERLWREDIPEVGLSLFISQLLNARRHFI